MKTYKEQFEKHDLERFQAYLESVKSGEAKIAAGALLRRRSEEPNSANPGLRAQRRDVEGEDHHLQRESAAGVIQGEDLKSKAILQWNHQNLLQTMLHSIIKLWPPSKSTRLMLVERITKNLTTSPSLLSGKYGLLTVEEAEGKAKRIEETEFVSADKLFADEEDSDGCSLLCNSMLKNPANS